MNELTKRYNRITDPYYQPEIDKEDDKIEGECLVTQPECSGDALFRNIREVYFDNDSKAENFFIKYEKASELLNPLKTNLIDILSSVKWVEESNYVNEQWFLDWLDALNEISTKY